MIPNGTGDLPAGAIGVAAWRGVPLSVVLERSGITREAVDVMPSGLDPDLVMAGVNYGRVRRPIPWVGQIEVSATPLVSHWNTRPGVIHAAGQGHRRNRRHPAGYGPRLRAHGAELLGEVAQYESIFLPCYLRGPAGIIVALAEQIG